MAIIAKNEEGEILDCILSASGAGEIIVIDTGSIDDTAAVAKRAGAKVKRFRWDDDFSSVYNFAKKQCTGEWILSLDADERIADSNVYGILSFLQKRPKYEAYRMLLNYETFIAKGVKLIKNDPTVYWIGKAHKRISTNSIGYLDIQIDCHLSESHKDDKFRTLRILQKEYQSGKYTTRDIYYLAREYTTIGQHDKALKLFLEFLDKVDTADFFAADACLYLAKTYRILGCIDKASAYAIRATYILPSYKEAWEFLCFLDKNNASYQEFAKRANNEGVLVIRKKLWSEANG